jgi:hypothetical protein
LWSCESAVYCAATWLPAYTLLAWRRAESGASGRSGLYRLRLLGGWLLLPLVLLGGTIGLLELYYRLRLGHAPDWYAFVEYCQAFSSAGYMSLPIDFDGAVWSLVVVLCAVATLGAGFLRDPSLRLPAALLGAWGAAWSSASYFVGRSHEVNATNLCPLLCLAIAVILSLLSGGQAPQRMSALVRVSLLPLLAIILTTGFGEQAIVREFTRSLGRGYSWHVEDQCPVLDPGLAQLFAAAQLKEEEPLYRMDFPLSIHLCNTPDGRSLSQMPAWLCATDNGPFFPLSPERRAVYASRFIARQPRSGWLLSGPFSKSGFAQALYPGLEVLARTHVPTRLFRKGDWQLTWCELRPAPPR